MQNTAPARLSCHHHPAIPILWLSLALVLLSACSPTGNRLNVGVISDPRSQPDSGNSSGNQGTATPTDASGVPAPIDPSAQVTPTGGTSSSSNRVTKNSGTPLGISSRRNPPLLMRAMAPGWSLSIQNDKHFTLYHRNRSQASAKRLMAGNSLRRNDGSIQLIVAEKYADAPTETHIGTIITAIERPGHLIVLDGDPLGRPGPLPMVVVKGCPKANTINNWISLGRMTATNGYGTLAYHAPSGEARQSLVINIRSGQSLPAQTFHSPSCPESRSITGGPVRLPTTRPRPTETAFSLLISPFGEAIMSDGTPPDRPGYLLALPVQAPTTLQQLSGHYLGLFDNQHKTTPVDLTCDALGQCLLHDPDSRGKGLLAITAANTPANGILSATLTPIPANGPPSPAQELICISDNDTRQTNIIACRASASTNIAIFVRIR